ncbi:MULTISPECIES: hypothetical protein [Capnocytophaga]|jgi:hypothetical protein|uniref:XRE family transcriptional regulator n=1 Tax=Capnocytophaga genosp. AHN8471 TaxID=327574 RepID=A0ABS1YTB4_9FLAO|nr:MULTISPECIES: hypothetical protein [Capnocytophaga]MBI1667446.1 hypothetical protein [Capnocytophaga periodontitidis]MBM0649634.1 hypothetical protein [Capnocytophaga genosp. AHN8471]MBM0663021.1 hypothetical protein [Capnocytophaga genosp. AHN8471]
MNLTKEIINFFSEKGEKQTRRMQLALAIGVSYDTVNRYIDNNNKKLDTTKCRSALVEITGVPNEKLFEMSNL